MEFQLTCGRINNKQIRFIILFHLGSEVSVGQPLPLPVQKVGVEQLAVPVLGLADPGQALHRGVQVLQL